MAETKIKKITSKRKKRHSTTDLIVKHTDKHLRYRERSLSRMLRGGLASTAIFAVAGLSILVVASVLFTRQLSYNSTYLAQDAQDYAAQEEFYTGEMLALNEVEQVLHAAAETDNTAMVISMVGIFMVVLALAYLIYEHGYLNPHRARFDIRRIR